MPLSPQAQALISFLETQGYVCPWGSSWDGLYKMLPGTGCTDGIHTPSLPLILAGWYASNNIDKALRLREHIEWADQHGVIDAVDEYLRSLPPESWHTYKNSAYVNGG